MNYMGKLAKYPELAKWYISESGKQASEINGSIRFIMKVCESLCLPPGKSGQRFGDCLDQFINSSTSPLNDYLNAESIVNQCNETLLDIISKFGEDAVISGNAARFLTATINAADRTGVIGLRFLAAWICLNTGDLKRCVVECEKVDEPYASIYTILGQALLEQGLASQAIEALTVAVKLSPQEVLAWFQLAKAHYATGNYERAFISLNECDRLAPSNIEIALFQAIVGNELDDSDIHTNAFRSLRPHLAKNPGDAEVVFNLLQLAVKSGDKNRLEGCLSEIDFDQLRQDNRFPKLVSPFLRSLYEKNWMALSARFLTGMTNCA